MGGLALLARAAGHRVTGCDAAVYPPMSTQLLDAGIELIDSYAADQINLNPDCYVVGNAISRGNPLLEEILNRGLPYCSGPEWLARHVLSGRWVLGVAGTHGKTTTASMLAFILEDAGLSPGFLIGGVPLNFGVSARLSGAMTDSPFFVIEADEYDTAFCDKRSKFIHYRPRTLILNNLEFDHADIFKDLGAIETQFHHLIRTLPQQALIVSNGREKSLERVLSQGCFTPIERFNESTNWHITAKSTTADTICLMNGVKNLGETTWALSGEHNRANAMAALLAARHVGVPIEQGFLALARFQNVKRRLEWRGESHGIHLYDDFAHHPTAIQTTIEGLREKIDGGAKQGKNSLENAPRILAVLEPRSNTMKLGAMKAALPESLRSADAVFCYSAHLSWDAKDALSPLQEKLVVSDKLDQLVAAISHAARAGDHILVMSNGGFGQIHSKILAKLADKN